jgi:hypothetical protein
MKRTASKSLVPELGRLALAAETLMQPATLSMAPLQPDKALVQLSGSGVQQVANTA